MIQRNTQLVSMNPDLNNNIHNKQTKRNQFEKKLIMVSI